MPKKLRLFVFISNCESRRILNICDNSCKWFHATIFLSRHHLKYQLLINIESKIISTRFTLRFWQSTPKFRYFFSLLKSFHQSHEMINLQYLQQILRERLFVQFNDAMTNYQSTNNFFCDESFQILSNWDFEIRYKNFTSAKKSIAYSRSIVFWSKGNVFKYIIIDCFWTIIRNWKNNLNELIQDCNFVIFKYDDKNVFNEKVRKVDALIANFFFTNFNFYNFDIVDAVAQKLFFDIVKIEKQSIAKRWDVVIKLYKLNVYSTFSSIFKSHVDILRERIYFESLVVILSTDFQNNILINSW